MFDQCEEKLAAGISVAMIRDLNIDVIIGPTCSYREFLLYCTKLTFIGASAKELICMLCGAKTGPHPIRLCSHPKEVSQSVVQSIL